MCQTQPTTPLNRWIRPAGPSLPQTLFERKARKSIAEQNHKQIK